MPGKRGLAILGARAVAGIVGIAATALAFGAVVFAPVPTVDQIPASAVVSPAPSDQQRVCPGPLLTLAEDSSQAQATTSVGQATTVYGATALATDSVRPDVTGITDVTDVSDITAVDNSAVTDSVSPDDGAPLLLRVPVQDGGTTAPLVAGSQSQTAATETLGGLAVAACSEAVSEAWLVGGSTAIGRTSLVLLSNPTTVVASVDLTVFGETGEVDSPGSTGILVQPGSQRIISLAGLAPNLISPVVHVQSHGGQVVAALEQSVVRAIEPGGVELLGMSGGPALEQIIAGVLVTTLPATDVSTDSGEFPDETPTVRILVPGDVPATVEVSATSENGQGAGTSLQFELQPGIATEVPLPELTSGSFAVRVTSDQPIVAAARTSTVGTVGKDFAWFAASGPLSGDFMLSVAPGPSPTLHLINTDRADATLTVTPERGAPTEVAVPSGESAILPLASAARYVVTGGHQIVASVSYAGDGLVSSFTLSPAGPLVSPIRVYSH